MRATALLGLVALLLSGPLAQSQTRPATQQKQAELRKKLSGVRHETNEVRQELRQKKREVWVVSEEMKGLDTQISNLDEKIDDTRTRLRESRRLQGRLAAEYAEVSQELKSKREVAGRRIRSMYVDGNESVLSVLVGARDLADFASRKALLERIAERDRTLFVEVKALRDEVASRKAKQDRVVAEVQALEARQREQQDTLDTAMGRKESLLDRLREERETLEEELEAMLQESRRIQAQIQAFQRANVGRGPVYRGGFASPLSGRLSSGFGYRIHPISRTRRMHTGIDIAAPTGSPIRAAGSGTVISAGWMRGYGLTVIIDHGGGRSTLYAHCSRVFVRAGQRVGTGDRIAAVGSTGFSTGPHLHFEVRIDGVPVDPRGR